MTSIEFDRVSRDFTTPDGRLYRALDDISFAVSPGSFVAIVGPSGCGKSTLLNIAAGLLTPSSGSVRVDGDALTGLNRRATYMFQQDALLPWKTVRDNVALGLTLGGVARPEARARASTWLGRVGLAAFGDHMLNAVPRVVLAPLFLLWFGLGIWSKVALAVTLVFFIMFFNTYQGVRDADRVLVDNVRMLGATERQLVRHVLIPSALTWIFSSLQTSLGFAMVGAVVGEYLGSTRGLGYVISQAEGTFDTTGVFAGMTVLGIVVVILSAGVTRLERWLLRWKE